MSPISCIVTAIPVAIPKPGPEIDIPTENALVDVVRIVFDCAVICNVLDATASEPGFEKIVNVCDVPSPKFENSSSSDSLDSFELLTANEVFIPLAAIFDKFGQPVNSVWKYIPAPVMKISGLLVNLVQ